MPAASYVTPAPVDKYIMPALAVSYVAPAHVDESCAPAVSYFPCASGGVHRISIVLRYSCSRRGVHRARPRSVLCCSCARGRVHCAGAFKGHCTCTCRKAHPACASCVRSTSICGGEHRSSSRSVLRCSCTCLSYMAPAIETAVLKISLDRDTSVPDRLRSLESSVVASFESVARLRPSVASYNGARAIAVDRILNCRSRGRTSICC